MACKQRTSGRKKDDLKTVKKNYPIVFWQVPLNYKHRMYPSIKAAIHPKTSTSWCFQMIYFWRYIKNDLEYYKVRILLNISRQIELEVKSDSGLNIWMFFSAYYLCDVPFSMLFYYHFVFFGQADHIYPGIPLKYAGHRGGDLCPFTNSSEKYSGTWRYPGSLFSLLISLRHKLNFCLF